MARKGTQGTSVPAHGKAFHIPADIKALGAVAKPIINEMRREHFALKRNVAPKPKASN